MKVRCRYLTLLEMLFVLMLISLTLGIIGMNIKKAVHEQRFRTEVATIVDTLRIAQYLMLILDNDVRVKFKKEDTGIQLTMETSCPLSSNWTKLILKPKILTTVRIVNFKDLRLTPSTEEGVAIIKFFSSGYVMSQGVLRMATADSEGDRSGLENFVCLPGYPSKIHSQAQLPKQPDCFLLFPEGVLENLTTIMVGEIKTLEMEKKNSSGSNRQDKPEKSDEAVQKK